MCVYVCNVCVRNFVDQNLIRIELDFLCEEFDKFLNLGPSKDPIRLLGYISQFWPKQGSHSLIRIYFSILV